MTGEYDKNMDELCENLQCQMNRRVEHIVFQSLRKLPLIDNGVQVLRTECGIRVFRVKSGFTAQECKMWRHYAATLKRALKGDNKTFAAENQDIKIPPIACTELLVINLNGLLSLFMTGKSCLTARIKLIAVLVGLRHRFLINLPIANVAIENLSAILSYIFHEPEQKIRQLVVDHDIIRCINYTKRRYLFCGEQSYTPVFRWVEREAYQRYCGEVHGSRVLTTIHMGEFFSAFRFISHTISEPRTVISLMRENPDHLDTNMLVRSGSMHNVLKHGQYSAVDVITKLRGGETTLAVMFDLGKKFGETVEVVFFGNRALFVKGPALLAIMGRAPIIPFFCYEIDGKSVITTEAIIDAKILAGESLAQAIVRVTQQLVSLAEQWICRFPAQWKYLDTILPYFVHGNDASQFAGSAKGVSAETSVN